MAVNKYIIQLIVETGSGEAKVKGVSQAFQQLERQVSRTNAALEKNTKAVTKGANASGLAAAATQELGRFISDLPYGIMAVTNNASQLGNIFSLLTEKSNGFRNAIGLVLKTLKGPAGIFIAFQIFIALIEVVSSRIRKSAEEVNKLYEEISKTTAKLIVLADQIESNGLAFNKLSILIKEANEENKNLNISLEESEDSYRRTAEQIREYVKALELSARVKAVQSSIEDEFKTILKEQQEQVESTVASYNFIGKAYKSIKGTIIGFYEGITGASVSSEKKIADSQFKITQLLLELDELFRKGYEGDPRKAAEDNAKEIFDLQQKLTLARIKNEEARLNKELEFINKKLEAEGITTEESLKLQIDKEAVLDKIDENRKEAEKKRLEDQKTLSDLNKELILESIDDERVRLEQKIYFIDEEIAKEIESTEEYVRLQLEKQKAINALAKAEEKYRNESEKEDDRVNDLRAKLFRARLSENEVLERKWLKSQIESLSTILESESLTDEQRAQAELDLYNYKKELSDKEQKDKESILASIQTALSTVSDLVDSNADRQIDVETNKTNAINDRLKERLATEQLTAEQRDEINQQISRNEAALVEKENEINKKRFQQQKALQIAQALVETYRTSWLAFGSQLVIGDPSSAFRAKIAQAVALAAGLANVAMIARQQFVGKAMPTPNLTAQGTSIPESQGPSFNVVGAAGQNQLAAAIAGQFQEPVRAYVVSSDVTTAQELDRRIVQGASI